MVSRVAVLLVAVLVLMLLATHSASAAARHQAEKVPSVSAVVVANLIDENARQSGEGAEGISAIAYDLASDFTVAARELSALSKAGQVADRGGLTRAGRTLAKHNGREGSVFPRPTGNPAAINQQGQAALDDILGSVGRTSPNKYGGLDYYGGGRGGGARFDADGNFIGFLEP